MPPHLHGPGSKMATQEVRWVNTLHGEVLTAPCICRWCDPFRYSRDFMGGGHQEYAEGLERSTGTDRGRDRGTASG